MTDNYFTKRRHLRKSLFALLREYDERTCGPSSDDPEVIIKVRKYLSQQQAKRESLTVILGIGQERKN